MSAPRRTDLVPLLRVVCVTLVLGSELWLLQPITDTATWSPLDGVLRAGNLAYAGLFALSGFAMTRLLLPLVQDRRRAAIAAGLRHTAAVLPVVLLTSSVVALVSLVDPKDTTPGEVTRQSVGHVLAFNWNAYVRERPLSVRTDLVPLWFFSVEAQLLLGLLVLIVVLGRRPRLLSVLVVAGIVGSFVWNLVVYADRGWFETSLRTDTHVDAVLCGVLAAVAARHWRWSPQTSSSVVGCGALSLVGLVLFASRMTLDETFRGAASATSAVVAVMLAAAAGSDGRGKVFDLVTDVPALRKAGHVWAFLLSFGAVVFVGVARHSVTWDAVSRILVAAALLAIVGYVTEQVLRPGARMVRERVGRTRRRAEDPEDTRVS